MSWKYQYLSVYPLYIINDIYIYDIYMSYIYIYICIPYIYDIYTQRFWDWLYGPVTGFSASLNLHRQIVSYLKSRVPALWSKTATARSEYKRHLNWPRLSQATFQSWCLQLFNLPERYHWIGIMSTGRMESRLNIWNHQPAKISGFAIFWSPSIAGHIPFGGSISVNIHCYSIHHHNHPPISNNVHWYGCVWK